MAGESGNCPIRLWHGRHLSSGAQPRALGLLQIPRQPLPGGAALSTHH